MFIDPTIPYWNILMKCTAYTSSLIRLPGGYRFRDYRDGDALEWAWLEHRIQEFGTFEEALAYFRNTYLPDPEALKRRFICVENPNGGFAGSVIAWRDRSFGRLIPTVHWLGVSPDEQRRGIGRALIQKLLGRFEELGEFPVYLHTQPASYVAVGVYSTLGFRVLKRETIMDYENQYQEAVEILRPLMPAEKYEKLLREAVE